MLGRRFRLRMPEAALPLRSLTVLLVSLAVFPVLSPVPSLPPFLQGREGSPPPGSLPAPSAREREPEVRLQLQALPEYPVRPEARVRPGVPVWPEPGQAQDRPVWPEAASGFPVRSGRSAKPANGLW